MQQRVTPKTLAENKRRDYGRVRNHLKVILSVLSIQESVVKFKHEAILSVQSIIEFVLE